VCLSGARIWSDGKREVVFEGVLDPKRLEHSAFLEISSPEECLLLGLQIWGSKFFQEIAQFRVVIWDSEKAELTCIRDATGAQSFYYTVAEHGLAFASDIDVLAGLTHIRLTPDNQTIGLHLANRIFEEHATLFKDVRRLPPGHMLIANRNGIQVSRYRDFDPAAVVRLGSDEEYAEEFLRILQIVLKDSITEKDQHGLLLSGGLDSSSLACVAHNTGHQLNYFSLVSRTNSFNESLYVKEIAAATRTGVTEVSYESEVEPFLGLEAWNSVHVLYSPMMRFCEALFRAANQAGSTVLLTGFGGDELFSTSQQYLSELVRNGAVLRAWKQAQYDANVWGSSRWRVLWRHGVRPMLPTVNQRQHRNSGAKQTVANFINPEFLESSGALHYIESRIAPEFPHPEQRQIFWALRYGWNIVFQLEQIERLARQYGLELRHPFLDNRLMEFVVALPSDQRHRTEGDRYILRNAMRGLMPEKVRTRVGKSDLAGVIDRELRAQQADEVRALLMSSKLAELGAADREKLLSAFENFVNGSRKIDASEFETVVGLELWLRNLEKL
jgi:asparagine synthase (glutamine-hydrolysing)